MYSKEQMIELLRQYGYPDYRIDATITRLNKMEPEIQALFKNWVQTGAVPDDEINGFTFAELVNEYGFTPINAFLTFNWLVIDPENASTALEGGIK